MGHEQLTDEQLVVIANLIEDGKKIEAIKIYREATGADLSEAKAFVDGLDSDGDGEAVEPISRGGGGGGELSDEVMEKIRAAVMEGELILAIKHYREATGKGLKESKQYIDTYRAELKAKHPDLVKESKGCMVMLVVGIWLIGAVWGVV